MRDELFVKNQDVRQCRTYMINKNFKILNRMLYGVWTLAAEQKLG